MAIKWCNKCQSNKSAEQFYKNRAMPQGLSGYCKICTNSVNKCTPSGADPARRRARADRSKTKHFGMTLLRNARQSARKFNLEFNIDVSDVVVPMECPILHIPLFRTMGKRTANTPSIDRIDNAKGYIKGNVEIISWRANELKRDASLTELKSIVDYMELRSGY